MRELSPKQAAERVGKARHPLAGEGAHTVLDSVADLLPIIDEIERRLAAGQRP